MKITDKETGEIFKVFEGAPPKILSEARRVLSIEIKELEEKRKAVDDYIAPDLERALEAGETKFAGYWQIRRGARRFSESILKAKATKTEIKKWGTLKNGIFEIEDKYKKQGRPFLVFPKL